RHDHEEDHDQPVRGGEHVVFVWRREDLQARVLQLGADRDRHARADHAGEDREHQVHRADVLVVGRVYEAPPTGRMTVGLVSFMRAVRGSRVARHHSRPWLSLSHVGPGHFIQGHLADYLVASATAVARLSSAAYFFLASSIHAAYCCSLTTCTAIGMKAWSRPQSCEHWP